MHTRTAKAHYLRALRSFRPYAESIVQSVALNDAIYALRQQRTRIDMPRAFDALIAANRKAKARP